MASITSADAVLVLSAPDFLPADQIMEGWSTDDQFSTTRVANVETQLGVDGFYAAGFVFVEKVMDLMFIAASPSVQFFEQLNAAQEAAITAFELQGMLTLPSVGTAYVLDTGYLTGSTPFPNAKRVLQTRTFELRWRLITPVPIGIVG